MTSPTTAPAEPTGPAVVPSRTDPVVRAASGVLGGPVGDHAGGTAGGGAARGGPWRAAPVLALAAVVPVALAALTRAHCRSTGWASPDQFVHACYSDVPAMVANSGASGQPPTTAVLLRALDLAATTPRGAFDLAVLLGALAMAVATLCVVRTREQSPWDAALVALSPVVVTAGLVSVDLVAVALVASALLALHRHRPAVAGALLGLAAGVRPAVALVLVAVWLVVLVGRREQARAAARDAARGPAGAPEGGRRALGVLDALAASASAVLAAGLVTLAARVGTPTQTGGSRWWDGSGGAGYGAVWLLPGLDGKLPSGAPLPWSALPAGAVSALAAGGLVVVLLLGAAAAARTVGREPTARLAAVALVLVAGGLAVSPSVPVQATLVVLPLAAVAVPRWRDHLPWAVAECAYATGTWLYLYSTSSEDGRGLPAGGYGVLLVLRLATLAWLAVQGVRWAGRHARTER